MRTIRRKHHNRKPPAQGAWPGLQRFNIRCDEFAKLLGYADIDALIAASTRIETPHLASTPWMYLHDGPAGGCVVFYYGRDTELEDAPVRVFASWTDALAKLVR